MNKKILISVLLVIILSFTNSLYAEKNDIGKVQIVRIGINFNDSITGIKTALSDFKIESEDGLLTGIQKANDFLVLFRQEANNQISVSKDVYREKGTIGGPFHIKISDVEYTFIDNKLNELKQNKIKAFVSYTNNYEIWTGSYNNYIDADNALKDIQQSLKNEKLSIVPPSDTRIILYSKDSTEILAFDNEKDALRIKSANDDGIFKLNSDNKKRYRGELEICRKKASDLNLINIINIEKYLYGVVPYEIGASAPMEALKAQAVAARTYTLNNLGKYSRLGFDLCNTVYSQVYKGVDGETSNTNKAVYETSGKRVMYNGKLASVFYFASSGGQTEDVKNVWGSEVPYLKSVEDKYEDKDSWHYNWEVSKTADEVENALKKKGINLGKILGIEITKRSQAGRAIELVIKGEKDKKVLKNESCRTMFLLDSQWFDIYSNLDVFVNNGDNVKSKVQIIDKMAVSSSGIKNLSKGVVLMGQDGVKKKVDSEQIKFIFKGKGWGHAVGMSQEGAIGMAKAGFGYLDILKHYFVGVNVE